MTRRREMGIAQIDTGWQEGVANPLTGDEEEAARRYINSKLSEWRVMADNENVNDYIARAWDEWIATDEAARFAQNR